jgi:hypothetical protein
MKYALKSVVPNFVLMVVIALVGNIVGGGLIPSLGGGGQARAATLSVQSVAITPPDASSARGAGGAGVPAILPGAVGSGFTYQGRLLDAGVPANGQYDISFTLWDALSAGNHFGSSLVFSNQTVSAGVFTVALDFGPGVFTGEARWLQVAVRSAGVGSYVALTPRQPLTATPFALSSRWEGTTGKPFPYTSVPQANVTTTLTRSLDASSLTVGADGLGLISYVDSGLRVAHCVDLACSAATSNRADPSSSAGIGSSITIGADGLPLVSYLDPANSTLKVAHCANGACGAASWTAIGSGPGANQTAITVGADGLGLIAFNGDSLKVAHCVDVACSAVAASLVDTNTMTRPSLTIGADGLGLIAYTDSGHRLKVAHCSNPLCSAVTISTLDSMAVLADVSIVMGSDGFALISYSSLNGVQLRVAHCANALCNAATLNVLDPAPSVGSFSSITLGLDGLAIISYYDNINHSLKLARCANTACSSAAVRTLDTASTGPRSTSVTIGTDGVPLISFADYATPSLKVVHCGSPACISYQHSRR